MLLGLTGLPDRATVCAVVTDLTTHHARVRLEQEVVERHRIEAELRQRNAELAASEARFRSMAETVPDILFATTDAGITDYTNGRFREYTGILSATGNWTDLAHPDDRSLCESAWADATETRRPFEVRCRLRSRDGGHRWFQVRARPIVPGGQWFGVASDIDAMVRAEQALQEADQRKDRFLVQLAHELRNPLAPIRDGVQFLDRLGGHAPEAVRTLEMIER
ncbi:MAG: PAS domain-containing protein, partial [Actinobacteria bacterium]|nr:PAS domain-containing protein [Actinomycetota bacterium]